MIGRNGMDALNRFLSVVLLVLVAVEMFLRGRAAMALSFLSLVLLAVIYFRMFSRNLYRRSQENGTYLRLRYPIVSAVQGWRDRFRQRKEYRFFRAWLRVPRGKGQINIVCRKCGTSFRRRS